MRSILHEKIITYSRNPGQQIDRYGRIILSDILQFSQLPGVDHFVNFLSDLLTDPREFGSIGSGGQPL